MKRCPSVISSPEVKFLFSPLTNANQQSSEQLLWVQNAGGREQQHFFSAEQRRRGQSRSAVEINTAPLGGRQAARDRPCSLMTTCVRR